MVMGSVMPSAAPVAMHTAAGGRRPVSAESTTVKTATTAGTSAEAAASAGASAKAATTGTTTKSAAAGSTAAARSASGSWHNHSSCYCKDMIIISHNAPESNTDK